MKRFGDFISWLINAFKKEMVDKETKEIEKKLDRIEKRLSSIEKSAIPLGLFCSGLPVMAIGLAGVIQDITKNGLIENVNSAYFGIGTLMITLSMMIYYNRVLPGIIVFGVLSGVIIILYIITKVIL